MARNFKELQARMNPVDRADNVQRVHAELKRMALDELRDAKHLTQAQVAEVLGVPQSSVSRIEQRTDMYLSTLRNYIHAVGGELRIQAVFPDGGTVVIDRFGDYEERPYTVSALAHPVALNQRALQLYARPLHHSGPELSTKLYPSSRLPIAIRAMQVPKAQTIRIASFPDEQEAPDEADKGGRITPQVFNFSDLVEAGFEEMAPQSPEEVFNAAFPEMSVEDQKHYHGRHNLAGLLRQLRLMQQALQGALHNEKQNVPEHVEHPPFHVDYVDADVPNALAFRYGGYSFIGITLPLIYSASGACLGLSKSPAVAHLLGLEFSAENYNELHAVLFTAIISFIVSHEFTHHVFGHVIIPAVSSAFPNEILDNGKGSSLDAQVHEVVADGYAVYHVLSNFLDGPGRSWLKVLKLDRKLAASEDQILLSLIVLAVGAYFFLRPSPRLSLDGVLCASHPPQIVRMDCMMQELINWSRQNRPELERFMVPARFQELMNAATEATLGSSCVRLFATQGAFIQSPEGRSYQQTLWRAVNDYKQSL